MTTCVYKKINVEKIKTESSSFLGRHDLNAFRSAHCQSKSSIKTIEDIHIKNEGEQIIFNVCAKSFLHSQVRIMVGTLVDIAKGNNNKTIIGYGAPANATTDLNFFGISKEIDYIVEDNKLKHGKFLPGMNIPIKDKKALKSKADYALVLAWNFFDEIKKKNSDLADKVISIKDLEI